jgi:hypothetical protein
MILAALAVGLGAVHDGRPSLAGEAAFGLAAAAALALGAWLRSGDRNG